MVQFKCAWVIVVSLVVIHIDYNAEAIKAKDLFYDIYNNGPSRSPKKTAILNIPPPVKGRYDEDFEDSQVVKINELLKYIKNQDEDEIDQTKNEIGSDEDKSGDVNEEIELLMADLDPRNDTHLRAPGKNDCATSRRRCNRACFSVFRTYCGASHCNFIIKAHFRISCRIQCFKAYH